MYMSRFFSTVVFILLSGWAVAQDRNQGDTTDGWISLFDGKTLNGWKINEHPETFKVENGAIVVNGERSHLFYEGDVADHDFKNFELKVEVMTFPGSNSGIYFHTQFQENGFPEIGHEVQVNISHTDW